MMTAMQARQIASPIKAGAVGPVAFGDYAPGDRPGGEPPGLSADERGMAGAEATIAVCSPPVDRDAVVPDTDVQPALFDPVGGIPYDSATLACGNSSRISPLTRSKSER
ncbi:hypothetical protein [Streptomyces sp. NPDC055299]